MAAPVIYRSTDTNAPVLFGGGGSLISLLDAILVNGYGSAFATGTITSDGTNPSDGDTVTIGSVTYTYRTSVAGQPANSLALTSPIQRLQNAVNGNGTVGSDYSAGTVSHPDVWMPVLTGGNLIGTPTARKGGSAGNSLVLARTSAGTPHISVSGANMTGGSGSDTKAGAGWTKPYSGSPASQQGVYRQPAGSRFYLQVDDSGSGTGGVREARSLGFEAMTAYNVGSGQFPTVAQAVSSVPVIRKSNSLDNTARSWIVFADDRTFYLLILSADVANHYHGFSFGDFYSLIVGDAYKCLIMGGSAENAAGSSGFGQSVWAAITVSLTGHWLPRNYSGFGGSTNFVKVADFGLTSVQNYMAGTIGFPNADGGVYLSPLRIIEGSNPGASLNGSIYLRGRVRGLFQICHPVASFVDGDVITGSGAYAGRTFQVVKFLQSAGTSQSFCAIETTPWAVSA